MDSVSLEKTSFLSDVAKDDVSFPTEEKVSQLTELVNKQLELDMQIEYLEAETKKLKEELLTVKRHNIPDLMETIGVKKIVLENGAEIKIKNIYTGKLLDKEKGYNWLEHEGHGAIVRTTFEISCQASDEEFMYKVRKLLSDNKIQWEEISGVHHMKLAAWVKEMVETGKASEINREVIEVYVGKEAVIKI